MKIGRRVFVGAAAAFAVARPAAAAPPVLRRGVNLWPWFSLTREFPAPRTDYAWPPFQTGRPTPTSVDLARLRAAGFDFVRIPVDPGPLLAAAPAQRRALLDEVAAAASLSLANDLAAIVNLHSNGATHHWNPPRMLAGLDAPAFPAYRDLTAELAGRLARLGSPRLILEPVNEPPQACGAAEWEAVQRSLLGAARLAAPGLTLVATGACGSMIEGLLGLSARELAPFEPLLFTFHFYEPYLFSHQGAPWMTEPVYRSLNAVPWPASSGSLEGTLAAVRVRMARDSGRSEAQKRAAYAETEQVLRVYFKAQPDRSFIDRNLAPMRAWAEREGVPPGRILLGEFGALRSDSRYVAAGAADRARYIADVRRAAEALGFPWAFWNAFDGMGLMDDVTRRLDPAVIEALGLTMPP